MIMIREFLVQQQQETRTETRYSSEF